MFLVCSFFLSFFLSFCIVSFVCCILLQIKINIVVVVVVVAVAVAVAATATINVTITNTSAYLEMSDQSLMCFDVILRCGQVDAHVCTLLHYRLADVRIPAA